MSVRPTEVRQDAWVHTVDDRTVPWFGLVSSAAAPVLLVGGWTVAAARQQGGFDSLERTISDLAAYGADDRWIMTTALAGLGLCHLTTAAALRQVAAPAGRAVLAAGGATTVLVAVFPLPADGSGSTAHTLVAGTAFLAMSLWPALAVRRDGPALVRPVPSAVAAATLLGLLVWFGVQLRADEGVGLAERVTAGAQALWPLAVTGTTWAAANAARRRRRRS